MTAAAPTSESFVDLSLVDWEDVRRAHLERVSLRTTVGQTVSEAVDALQLPAQGFYQALLRGRTLDPSDSLEEAGIASNEVIQLVPRVSAGNVRVASAAADRSFSMNFVRLRLTARTLTLESAS
jgi:hypothetical protein